MNSFQILGVIVVAAPAILVAVLGIASIIDRPFSERWIGLLVQTSIVTGLLASIAILAMMLQGDQRRVPIELGHWVELQEHGATGQADQADVYHFKFKFEFDRLSVPFVILTFLLCGTIGAFADKYMQDRKSVV